MNRIFHEHRQRNADSRDRWECFVAHRRKVTDLLLGAHPTEQGRLCVLGAGNCNDLELSELTKAYAEVHLVDLDEAAVSGGVAAQDPAQPNRIHVHGGIDLAGCNEIVSSWTPERSPAAADIQRCLATVTSCPAPQLPAPFNVVASVCLLTQLIDSVSISLGSGHPSFMELLTRVRRRHIRLLLELLQPGGTAILITDFVSSVTCPALAATSADDLPALAANLIKVRNFFTGTNPAALHALFETDGVVAPQVGRLEVTRPWLWDFGPRTYAVCAISAGKRGRD